MHEQSGKIYFITARRPGLFSKHKRGKIISNHESNKQFFFFVCKKNKSKTIVVVIKT